MLLDILNSFTHIAPTSAVPVAVDEQAITTGTAVDSTNTIDLGASKNQSIDDGLYLHIRSGVACDKLTSIIFYLETAETAALIASAPVTIYTSSTLLKATMSGDELVVRVRVPGNTQRFLRLSHTVAGTTEDAGTFQAFLSPSVQDTYAVS